MQSKSLMYVAICIAESCQEAMYCASCGVQRAACDVCSVRPAVCSADKRDHSSYKLTDGSKYPGLVTSKPDSPYISLLCEAGKYNVETRTRRLIRKTKTGKVAKIEVKRHRLPEVYVCISAKNRPSRYK
jgi:hypothetical protein